MSVARRERDAAVPGGGPAAPGLALRPLVVACAVLGRERAELLLEGLAGESAAEAQALLQGFRAQESRVRQARLTVEFGLRLDADARVQALVEEAPPGLQRSLLRCLPPYQRGLIPCAAAVQEEEAPCLVRERLAARLVREATR